MFRISSEIVLDAERRAFQSPVMRYADKLAARIKTVGSGLCVGLDPRPELTDGGIEAVPTVLRQIVEETAEYAAAFKPNMAYFEAMGLRGIEILDEFLSWLPREVPIILDAKRSDIGETQKYYARSYFENWGVDAVTLNPFLGYDTLEPFLDFEGKGIYLLSVTSNPGSADIERQMVGDRYVYELVQDFGRKAVEEGRKTDVGFVVGLTNAAPEVLERTIDLPLLIPGLGAQGGDVASLAGSDRTAPDVVNVSRGISYAKDDLTYAQRAKKWSDVLKG